MNYPYEYICIFSYLSLKIYVQNYMLKKEHMRN